MYTVVEKFAVSDILLDPDNPRIKDILHEEFYDLKNEQQQLVIMFYLIVEDNILSLLNDIIFNTELSKAMLVQDSLIVQEVMGDKFVVREGNRRLTCLKIINQGSTLLEEIEQLITNLNGINVQYTRKLKKNISSLKKSILNFSLSENYTEFDYVRCTIYDSSEKSNRVLDVLLRKLHVTKKKDWESVDQKLYDYNTIMKVLRNGEDNVESAIRKYLSTDLDVMNITQGTITKVRKEFIKASFYNYLLGRISNGNIIGNPEELKIRLRKSFLPVCEVLFLRVCKLYQINPTTKIDVIDDRVDIYFALEQQEGSTRIEIIPLIDDLVSEVLDVSKPKPMNHAEYNNSEKFKSKFSEIISRYDLGAMNTESNENVLVEDGIFLANGKKHLSVDVPILNEVNLLDYVDKVYQDGKPINKELITIFENSAKIAPKYEVQETAKEVKIHFVLGTHASRLTINFIEQAQNDRTPVKKLLPVFGRDNTLLSNLMIEPNLLYEIDTFDYNKYKYITSTVLRVLWEKSARTILMNNVFQLQPSIHTKDLIDKISDYIKANYTTKGGVIPLAAYYKLVPEEARLIGSPGKNITFEFKQYYANLNAPLHGQHETVVCSIDELGVITSKWLHLLSFILHEKSN